MNPVRRPILRGTLILTASGLVCWLIGSYYRIVLVRHVSVDALGLFQLLLPSFQLAVIVAMSGIPVAITRLTAARPGSADHRPAVVGLSVILVMSVMVTALMWFGAPVIAGLVADDERTVEPLRYLSLAILPMATSAGLSAWFQGEQRTAPQAVGNLVEVCARVAAVLTLVRRVSPHSAPRLAAMIAAGTAAAHAIRTVALLVWRRADRVLKVKSGLGVRRVDTVDRSALKKLVQVSLPLLTGQIIDTILLSVGVSLIPHRLVQAGLSHRDALHFYGLFSGMATPVVYMPLVFVTPVAQMLVPLISARDAVAPGGIGVRRALRKAFAVALLGGLTAMLCMYFWPRPLANALYRSSEVAFLLPPLSLLALPLYTNTIAAAALQGFGRTDAILRNSLVGKVARLSVIYLLAGRARFGVRAVVLAVILDQVCAAFGNVTTIMGHIKPRPEQR